MILPDAGGFGAEVHLAPDLAAFLGTELLPRTEVTKRIWAYIKENDLQDPADKRIVVCDAELEKVMKRKTVHMFKMTKILSAVSNVGVLYQVYWLKGCTRRYPVIASSLLMRCYLPVHR